MLKSTITSTQTQQRICTHTHTKTPNHTLRPKHNTRWGRGTATASNVNTHLQDWILTYNLVICGFPFEPKTILSNGRPIHPFTSPNNNGFQYIEWDATDNLAAANEPVKRITNVARWCRCFSPTMIYICNGNFWTKDIFQKCEWVDTQNAVVVSSVRLADVLSFTRQHKILTELFHRLHCIHIVAKNIRRPIVSI